MYHLCVFCFFLSFVQLFNQFDADGEGFADVETFLEVCIKLLKKYYTCTMYM